MKKRVNFVLEWERRGNETKSGAVGAMRPHHVGVAGGAGSRPENNTTMDRGSARYMSPETKGARSQSSMSCGESRKVSIHRRQPAATGGSSNSSGSSSGSQ